MSEVEKEWNKFWKHIVVKENGEIDIEQLKRELYSFSILIGNASMVYCHITGGLISRVSADPENVIKAAENHFNETK